MNTEILNTEIQDFITNNLAADISKLILKGTNFKTVSTLEIIEQIEAKGKSKNKLPTWFANKDIYYPNKLNIEQTSSEITAAYKSELLSGKSLIDLTGGFGVDCYYFAKSFETVTHCEIDEDLSQIVAHNNIQLGITNIQIIASNGIEHLLASKNTYDWIYIDPSRRHEQKGKVFFLKDCLPDVPKHLNALLKHSNSIAIKTSPLLDISVGIKELQYVKDIHVVAVKNEVKELIWIIENGFDSTITIKTVNILADTKDVFSFSLNGESKASVTYELPLQYLYEPNSSILKSGGFNSLAETYKLSKLHQHSHLYTSDHLVDFPGRRFKIETVLAYNKKSLKALGLSKANITTRNFPETVQQIRKKHRIKDGSQNYLFFTTNVHNEKIVVVCSKI
ncbi:THUMP-like domain-containing protein [Psychroserpens algicola]|uniref:Class I SAM-dependent methyltransferase n=1 Tax=Psychroserpens algicola TaxID=1719034 RepID=A0ABT0HAN0_9FLAO|nr:class I SAM-dependent methyltransferase [Psychroserpens algicola]MCK8481426.1 class I SAM-dependent methyltransferase [Psychroserpens algicola]